MENTKKSNALVILGPTSSGKSDVAIRLAKKFNGEIISADSRQIYRGMDIGTGKVEPDYPDEIPKKFSNRKFPSGFHRKKKIFISAGIVHYMIDIVSPKTRFSAAQFKKRANRIISDIIKRRKLPIICGGTGFWIKAIVDNVTYPEVKPDWKLRKELNKKTAQELLKMLKKLDSRRAKNIDKNNKVRLIRAIEICKSIGNVPALICNSELVSGSNKMLKRVWHEKQYEFLQIGVNLSKEQLHKNIRKRLKKRFQSGMIEEVNKLRKQGLSWKKIQSFGLGYFWIPEFLKGKIASKQELFEKIYSAEKDYAKRQMTWFQKDQRIKWIEKYKDIEKEAKLFLK